MGFSLGRAARATRGFGVLRLYFSATAPGKIFERWGLKVVSFGDGLKPFGSRPRPDGAAQVRI
jgi:hypothetical protein